MINNKETASQPSALRAVLSLGAAAILLMGFAAPAAAHVAYKDLSDPVISPGGVNGGAFSNTGWYDGTTTTLGDSHSLAGGDFFKFHLSQDSLISITFSDDAGLGQLNPAFSVYNGLFADEAHDDTSVDPLNPRGPLPTATKLASAVDNGVTTDAFGHVSPFRDTANIDYAGQFDALHSWSMANEFGDWSVAEYITHVGPTGGNSVSLLNFLLHAGDYTIAAAGGSAHSVNDATGIAGTISLNVAAVPVPASIWLFGSAIAGFGAFRKKRLA